MAIIGLLVALLIGVSAGTLTGLAPGIHINLVAAFLLSFSPIFLTFTSPLILVIFIVSLSISHIFTDFIPSIFLGAPDDDTALSVQPGHELLLEGKGHEAVLYSILGCLFSVLLLLFLLPIFIFIIPKVYPIFQRVMFLFLLYVSIFLILKEKNSKIWALIIFILAGFLGIASLRLPVTDALLPMFTGLFGTSTLIYSITQKTSLPEQTTKTDLQKKEFLKPFIASFLISPFCAFLPGLGSSQAAIISSEIFPLNRKQFLTLVGSVDFLVMSLSFVVLFLINKSRTGSAAAVSSLLTLNSSDVTYIILAIVLSSAISFFIALKLSKLFAKNITKINYSKLSYFILGILILAVIIFSGFWGFLILLASTSLGLLACFAGVRKGHLMGSLLIPTMLFYLPFL